VLEALRTCAARRSSERDAQPSWLRLRHPDRTGADNLTALADRTDDRGPRTWGRRRGSRDRHGYGYQAALLAKLARYVFSVERIPELAEIARHNLKAEGVLNAEVVTGDGTLGLPSSAPFDGIVVAAAFLRVPDPLAAQLAPGGRL